MGILVEDVFFCADVVFPERVIDRYKMPYLYSVREHLASLDRAVEVSHAVRCTRSRNSGCTHYR